MSKKNLLALLLLFLLFMPHLPEGEVTLAATLSPPQRLNQALSWVREQEGACWDLDERYGAQCSDLVSAYMNLLSAGDPLAYVFDVYDARFYPSAARMQADKWWVITQGAPLPGDIFVSKGGAYYGHTGIILSPRGESCLILDQNSASPDPKTGCPACLHEVSWTGAYERTHLIRFKGFWSLTARPPLPLVESSRPDFVTLKLQQVPGTSGICVALSKDSRFKHTRFFYTRKSSLTLSRLKKNHRYYLKARCFLNTTGGRYYGEYSPVLSFKTLP